MQIQVNSDNTIKVTAGLTRFVTEEVNRVLERFSPRLTRAEVHLSDVNHHKAAGPDKRCVIEVRPAGAHPLSTHATAAKVDNSLSSALNKMRRMLTTFFGRQGWSVGAAAKVEGKAPVSAKTSVAKKKVAAKTAAKTVAKKTAAKKAVKKVAAKKKAVMEGVDGADALDHGPKKKRTYQARSKAWPSR